MRLCLVALILFLTPVACVHFGRERSVRAPSADSIVPNPGGLSDSESDLCHDFECMQFIAPCELRARNRDSHRVLRGMDEVYLRDVEKAEAAGYCAEEPRVILSDEYPANTCLFLFVRKGNCSAPTSGESVN